MKIALLRGLTTLALSFASLSHAQPGAGEARCADCAASQAPSPSARLLAPFPAPGTNPNPANPDPNARLGSPYRLDPEKGELVIEGVGAGYVLDGFYYLAPWAAHVQWIGLNGELAVSAQGFACVGDAGFETLLKCMDHQHEVTDELRNLEFDKDRTAALRHAVDNLLGRLRRIPNADDTRYLVDALVTTTPAGSSFVLESIDCDAHTVQQRYTCTLRSSAFRK